MENLQENHLKLSPWENLCEMLIKYRIVNPHENEDKNDAVDRFLRQGKSISLPTVIQDEGRPKPYKMWPSCATECINSLVKHLEADFSDEISSLPRDEEDNQEILGCIELCDVLFQGAASDPRGQISLHKKSKIKVGEIELNRHGRRLKNLSRRLESYRISKKNWLKSRGDKLSELFEGPTSALAIVAKEVKNSQIWWNQTKSNNQKNPWDMESSLDYSFDAQNEANMSGWNPNMGSQDYDENEENTSQLEFEEDAEEYRNQGEYLGVDFDRPLAALGKGRQDTKGNVMSRPRHWIWRYQEDPLQYTVSYLARQISPGIEDAHSTLSLSFGKPELQETGGTFLLVNPKHKTNPTDWWKIMTRIADRNKVGRDLESDETLQKLDTARFLLSLEQINQKWGIDHQSFLELWEDRVNELTSTADQTTLRNQALIQTLEKTQEKNNIPWDAQKSHQWLENLQTFAIGSYENSVAMENQREKTISQLNAMVSRIREATSQIGEDSQRAGAVDQAIDQSAKAILKSLSGSKSQLFRRELRHKITILKERATHNGEKETEVNCSLFLTWLRGISKSIQEGKWFEESTQNQGQERLKGLLTLMVSVPWMAPSNGERDFITSPKPEPTDPVNISISFLKSYSGENTEIGFAGGKGIEEMLEDSRSELNRHQEGQIHNALKLLVSKHPMEIKNIKDRKRTLEKVLELMEKIHQDETPIETFKAELDKELDILNLPQDYNPKTTQKLEENLDFWRALTYIGQNIESRRETIEYQATPNGMGTLRNLIAIANAKITGKELQSRKFKLSKTRAKTLVPNVVVPLALWIQKPIKGVTVLTSHEDVLKSIQERKQACEICIAVSSDRFGLETKANQYKEIEEETTRFLNIKIFEDILEDLGKPEELGKALKWQAQNPEELLKISQSENDPGTPFLRMEQFREERQTPKKTTEKKTQLEELIQK